MIDLLTALKGMEWDEWVVRSEKYMIASEIEYQDEMNTNISILPIVIPLISSAVYVGMRKSRRRLPR